MTPTRRDYSTGVHSVTVVFAWRKQFELAHFVVTGVVRGESKYVTKFLKEKTQHWVDLKNPIPIHIRYFTCEFRNKSFFAYKDVYAKDKVLYELLLPDTNTLDL